MKKTRNITSLTEHSRLIISSYGLRWVIFCPWTISRDFLLD